MNYEVNIFPGDTLTVDGKIISGYEKFIPGNYHTIQYRSAGFNNEIEADSTLQMDTVGINLARERQPLMGLDYAIPNEVEEYSQSTARIVRVEDTIVLEQKVLPIEYLSQSDDEVELDLQVITRQGENGLAIDLTRIRRENGKELTRKTINSTTIRPSVDQILSFGTKAVVKQLEVGGTTIEYWRAVPMYATSYSPCRSGIDGCSYGTAGGSRAGKGIVAVVSRWFPYMRGQQVYIPGYGFAVIGDTGGGIPGTTWIDLGFDDDNYETWHQWVTVYFLTPIPTNILYILN
jgi:3D (Asp-Asp-Asp) domain-containing protein